MSTTAPTQLAQMILTELHRRGVSVKADGDALILESKEAIDTELLSRVQKHKPEIVRIIFGQSHARLFPFLGKQVWTPTGTGTLLSAFADTCEILPDATTKTIRVRTEDVLPLPIQ